MKTITTLTLAGFLSMSIGSAAFFVYQDQINVTDEDDLMALINQEMNSNPTASGKPAFDLLDAAQFTDTMYPWLGFPVKILSEQQLLGTTNNELLPPDELKVKNTLLKYKNEKRIILNITSWKIGYDKNDPQTARYIQWHLNILQWAKEILPATDIGLFGIPYSPWTALKSTQINRKNYQQIFQNLTPIIEAADTLYPLFKIFSEEENDLAYLMGAQLYLAKSSGKPVYPILSNKNVGDSLQAQSRISSELTKQQCNFVRQNADGMVWWSPEKEQWDSVWYNSVAKNCFL